MVLFTIISQEVIYEGAKEKWLVIPSYFTCGVLERL